MAQRDAYRGPALIGMPTVGCHDRVRVPDGRTGEVIGFYRDEVEQMLVLFDTGGSERYLRAELLRIRPFRAVAADDVHHDSDACRTGNFIELYNRVAGDGGLPLCKECAALRF